MWLSAPTLLGSSAIQSKGYCRKTTKQVKNKTNYHDKLDGQKIYASQNRSLCQLMPLGHDRKGISEKKGTERDFFNV
jgi:hypothetical protein